MMSINTVFDQIELTTTENNSVPVISVVVAGFVMERELPRTLTSLSDTYQQRMDNLPYEVLLVDNGSPTLPDLDKLKACCPQLSKVLMRREPSASPVAGLNYAISLARASIIGVMIDGARILSPGILARATELISANPSTVVGTYGFHLGPKVQMESVLEGYNQNREDTLLNNINFPVDGYRLFEISSLAGSSGNGWYSEISESNLFFTSKTNWLRLGGFDERFTSLGGGYANLEMWERLVSNPHHSVVMMLGEGTFHQVHGGTATNQPTTAKHQIWNEEYRQIKGNLFVPPQYRWMNDGNIESSELLLSFCKRKRPTHSSLPGVPFTEEQLLSIQHGVMHGTFHRGVPMFKSPFCQAIYCRLIAEKRPRSIIEIGSHSGGSALFFADQMSIEGLQPNLVCIDNNNRMNPIALAYEGIRFFELSAEQLGKIQHLLLSLPKPWLVVEDADHSRELCISVFESFRTLLTPGDSYVVEDGIVSYLGLQYAQYEGGPNQAIDYILANYPNRFQINRELCDLYGINVTWSPNGFLQVV